MKRTWPYINTPLPVFLFVMLPITGLMLFALVMPQRPWIRGSAAVVLAISLHATLRGYVRRITLDERGVTFHHLASRRTLAWSEIRRIDRYIPSGGINGVKYVYITANDRPPVGLHEIDGRTFQLQDRPGLLEALQAGRVGH